MARLVTCGYDTGRYYESADIASVAGAPVVTTTNVYAGAYSLKLGNSGDSVGYPCGLALGGASTYLRVRFRIPSGATAGYSSLAWIRTSTSSLVAASSVVQLSWGTDGSIGAVTTGLPGVSSGAGSAPVDTWHLLEVHVAQASATTVAVTASLNGTQFADYSGTVATNTVGLRWMLGQGTTGTTGQPTPLYDELKINDSTGTSQNGAPTAGQLVLLKPTTDSAKGTGWTNDAGTTTNLWDAVDNTPAYQGADTSAGTGVQQIRNATSNANSAYDATLTTYTAAGIGASDTISLVHPIVQHAAPVATSAKTGTMGLASNPAGTIAALNNLFGGGTFWVGTASGSVTGATQGWGYSTAGVVYAPTVTRSSGPVVRVNQVTASTRIAQVSFVGAYVDYIPVPTVTTTGEVDANAELTAQPSTDGHVNATAALTADVATSGQVGANAATNEPFKSFTLWDGYTVSEDFASTAHFSAVQGVSSINVVPTGTKYVEIVADGSSASVVVNWLMPLSTGQIYSWGLLVAAPDATVPTSVKLGGTGTSRSVTSVTAAFSGGQVGYNFNLSQAETAAGYPQITATFSSPPPAGTRVRLSSLARWQVDPGSVTYTDPDLTRVLFSGSNAHSGNVGAGFSVSSGTAYLKKQLTGLTPGTSYFVSVYSKVGVLGPISLGITDIGSTSYTATATNTWAQVTYTFTATSAQHELYLSTVAGGGHSADDLTVSSLTLITTGHVDANAALTATASQPASTTTGGHAKAYTAAGFEVYAAKVYDGSQFVTGVAKTWDGAQWVPVNS